MKESILQKLEDINDEQALKRLTDSIFKLTAEEQKERELEMAGQRDLPHDVDEIQEEDEEIDIDYGESSSEQGEQEQGVDDPENQSERLDTTVIKGPDGK